MAQKYRVAYKKDPILHAHRYIVVVMQGGKWRYHYCMNKSEVSSVCKQIKKGAVAEVYKASHNFIEAWTK